MEDKLTPYGVKCLIRKELKKKERSMAWLIRNSGIPKTTFYSRIDRGFTSEQLEQISKVLGVDIK